LRLVVYPPCVASPLETVVKHVRRREALGELAVETLHTSEKKAHGRKFIINNCDVEHVFVDAVDQLAGRGKCDVHPEQLMCRIDTSPFKGDLLVVGFPCQSFSARGAKRFREGSLSRCSLARPARQADSQLLNVVATKR
jgi:site-specific DNA-cytosine methylase